MKLWKFFLLLIPLIFTACSGGLEVDCVDDLDCPAGALCISGVCEGDECVFDEDCLDPFAVCVNGICVE